VAARTVDGRWVLFRQEKYAVDGLSLAPVGGYLEPGEDALAAAQRELQEESGFAAARWTPLGSFAVDGNRGAGTAHLFLAEQAEFIGATVSDDLEPQELVLLTTDDVRAALAAGGFKVLAWGAVMALALGRTAD
jgi:ADP-ribose pyrophosphatase